MERIGRYRNHKLQDEAYRTYVPVKLPIDIDIHKLQPCLDEANIALGRLSECATWVPDISLFLYMYVRQEATLSSQIEGTQSSLSDLLLFENDEKPQVSIDDVREISNYVRAIQYGLDRLASGFPLSLRLLKEIHQILLRDTRGEHSTPGEFRCTQNWIGGTRPGNAFFVPPTTEDMRDALYNLEEFFYDQSISPLLKTGITHVQFETIHPFLDGNGRMGRLLITLMLCNSKVLDIPILYPSLHFKENRTEYYQRLNAVRERGEWEDWLKFFLNAIKTTALQSANKIHQINALFDNCNKKIASIGRARFSCKQAFDYLQKVPQLTATQLAKQLSLTPPTVRKILKILENIGILQEISKKLRDKVYVFKEYMELLS